MAIRYCKQCATDVEDTGGFCLLGHSLALAPATSMNELQAEIDRVFDEARAEVSRSLGSPARASAPPPPPPPPGAVPPPPSEGPPGRLAVWTALETHMPDAAADDPIAAFAPAPRMDWGPERPAHRFGGLLRRVSRAPA